MNNTKMQIDFNTIPSYQNLTAGDWNRAFEKIVGDIDKFSNSLRDLKDITWESFWEPYVKLLTYADRAYSHLSYISIVNKNSECEKYYEYNDDRYNECLWRLDNNKHLHKHLLTLAKTQLPGRKKLIIENEIHHHRINGRYSSPSLLKKLRACDEKISTLEYNFQMNCVNSIARKKSTIKITDENKLGNMPATIKKSYFSQKGTWDFNFSDESYYNFMTYCTDRNLRKKMFYKYNTVCSEFDNPKYDNTKIIFDLLARRDEKAKLLGYENYADFVFSRKPDKDVQSMRKFILDISKIIKRKVRNNPYNLKGKDPDVQLWDVYYLNEQLQNTNDGKELIQYFKDEYVVPGLISFVEKLYKVKIKVSTQKPWHEGVKYYNVYDNRKKIGTILLDLYARENKSDGLSCQYLADRHEENGNHQEALVAIITNIAKSKKGAPGLMSILDVSGLFHEMGHAIHHISRKYCDHEININYYNNGEDEEMPSQFLEKFSYEWDVIKNIARHHETGVPIPKSVFDKAAQTLFPFIKQLNIIKRVKGGLFDLDVHRNDKNYIDTYKKINAETEIIPPPDWDRYCNRFHYLFSYGGDYAGYFYSYLWTEVYAADIFSKFKKRTNIDLSLGEKFRKEFLESGYSGDLKKSFKKFMGRNVDKKHLINHLGLNNNKANSLEVR